jgi:hypothetical protein
VDPAIPNVVVGRIPGTFYTDWANLDDIEAYLTDD